MNADFPENTHGLSGKARRGCSKQRSQRKIEI
jgi:hypothetical protein